LSPGSGDAGLFVYVSGVTFLSRLTGTSLLLASLCLAAACDRPIGNVISGLPASPPEPPSATVLRVPRAGGPARLYRVPSLDTIAWAAADEVPAVERVVGADAEQGAAFVLDRKNNLVALDLDTRRVRRQLSQVRMAVIGPDGVVYAVDTGSTVTRLVRRAPVRFRAKLQGTPQELHASLNGSLFARVGGPQPALEVLGSDRQPASIPLPEGAVASSRLGDLIAVAADTAVVLYSTDPKREPVSIRVSGGAQAVAFSPSGHRVYVVGSRDYLTTVDRFEHDVIDKIELPGAARDLRADAEGRWLLVRPETGDSIWVIDIGARRYVGTVAAPWGRDLPVVAAPNTLLARQGDDLVAFDLAGQQFPETGRVADGANDFWLPLAWHPAGETTPAEPAPDTAALAQAGTDSATEARADSVLADSAVTAPTKVYLQVSSSQNPTWAEEHAARLRAAELPASVLAPKLPDEPYRVVLGPYATREQAEEIGRGLGMPSFVITIQGE